MLRLVFGLLVPTFVALAQTCSPACSGSGPYTECCLRNMLAAQTAKGAVGRINARHIGVPWSGGLEGMIRSIGRSNKWSELEIASVVAAARAGSSAAVEVVMLPKEPEKKVKPPKEEPVKPVTEPPKVTRALRTWINPKDQLIYVWIPPGVDFTMGCSPGDRECFDDEKPPRRIFVDRGFWIGQTEVTQEAYLRVTQSNPSYLKDRPKAPVEHVNWNQARDYCTAVGGRLPLEDEWEYAARAGNPNSRYGPVGEIGWYNANSDSKTHDVASGGKLPSTFGLHEMLGNMWEWVADCYEEKRYLKRPNPDRVGKAAEISGCWRVLRGGSWVNNSTDLRASKRNRLVAGVGSSAIGLRCAGDFSVP